MNFELTISGMTVVALKSRDARPEHPEAVHVICPAAHHHRPLLSYLPGDVNSKIEPDMVVGVDGSRIASLELANDSLELSFKTTSYTEFRVTWGPPDARRPDNAGEEVWMNWVPTLKDLGFGGFPADRSLPKGAAARLTLPPGELMSRNIVKDDDPNIDEYVLWHFPVRDFERALANEMVYAASDVEDLTLKRDGDVILESRVASGETMRMAISTDLKMVPTNYNAGVDKLDHLRHLQALAPVDGDFRPPTRRGAGRTARPICNGALYVYS